MLQVVMGWENYHLHKFMVGIAHYGEPDPEDEYEMRDDRRVRLHQCRSPQRLANHTA